MKKIVSLIPLLLAGLIASANPSADTAAAGNETVLFTLNALAILLVIYIASSFLLALVRLFLGDRLRRTLLEKDASEEVITRMLPPADSMRQNALQWCCLLLAAGIGLSICYYNQPLGLNSAVIMSFSLAAGLLAYYLISKPKKSGQ
ncbi:hypothetical protein [Mucilaginibacter sp. KACC 22063]|uniref:hypothetical protein n=1 Tax=Mucilaginibacter sp. KACC 22063 TaxID=3025666 RepID=UPI0023671FE8|nr:hypothetical protein [Mucilaginibacter sp. KACC 22063]WDF57173.1 hypothetical protein PQ461_08915 [Mucilaginibacter sp. KACC 22063]